MEKKQKLGEWKCRTYIQMYTITERKKNLAIFLKRQVELI